MFCECFFVIRCDGFCSALSHPTCLTLPSLDPTLVAFATNLLPKYPCSPDTSNCTLLVWFYINAPMLGRSLIPAGFAPRPLSHQLTLHCTCARTVERGSTNAVYVPKCSCSRPNLCATRPSTLVRNPSNAQIAISASAVPHT